MYKVIIVEDEEIIRSGIKELLDWEEINCSIEGEAENGKEALKLIDMLSPDIIITDIKMPVMDGLEVAKYVKDKGFDTKVIFLTGYNEFNYAQEAIKNSVFDYILKPVQGTLMKEIIIKAAKELEITRKVRKENAEFKKILNINMPFLKENFIKQAVFYSIFNKDDVEEKINFFNMKFLHYQIIFSEIDNYKEVFGKYSEYDRQLYKYSIKNIMEEVVNRYTKGFVLDFYNNNFLILLGFNKDIDTIGIVEDVHKNIRKYLNYSLSFGISKVFSDFFKARFHFNEAQQALANKFYLGNGSIIFIEDLLLYDKCEKVDFSSIIEKVIDCIKVCDKTEAFNGINELIDNVREYSKGNNEVVTEVKNIFMELLVGMIKELDKLGVDVLALIPGENPYLKILSSESINGIRECFLRYIEKTIDFIEEKRNDQNSAVINRIMEYIKSHYYDEIKLEDVAALVHMNASYVSRIIKKVTGMNFVDILLDIRIGKARELLKDTEIKTYEVAEMVGIPDSKYFSVLFKRVVGMTPTEYRNFNLSN